MTIIRTFHNKYNPFVQLNKKPLQDDSLSLKAKGLWAMCLSRPDDWTFKIRELVSTLKEGERAIYSAIRELIANGYCFRWRSRNPKTGTLGEVEYIFFEFKMSPEELEEFKKSLPHCCFPHVDNVDVDFQGNLELPTYSTKKELTNIKESKPKKEPEPPPDPNLKRPSERQSKIASYRESEIPSSSAEAADFSSFFNKELNRRYPDRKQPNLKKWEEAVEKTHRIDKRSYQDMYAVLRWALDHDFWKKNILSPEKFRKQYDTLKIQMHDPKQEEEQIRHNMKTWDRLHYKHLRDPSFYKTIFRKKDRSGIESPRFKAFIPFKLDPHEFERRLYELYDKFKKK